jgi:general secretion pathway protein K
MTILTVIVLEFNYEVQVDAALKGNSFLALEAEYAARSGVTFCKAMLRRDSADDLTLPENRRTDSLDEEWTLAAEPIQVARSIVSTRIVDEDGRLCINRVISAETYKPDDKAVLQLRRLLTEFGMEPEITDTVLDWIDVDSVQRRAGAEGDYYRGLPIAYLCKNTWLRSIDELALVKGFTRDAVFGYRASSDNGLFEGEQIEPGLVDYLSVFGGRSGEVNINTAPELVLRAILGENTGVATEIVAGRLTAPFENMADLKQRVPAVIGIAEIGKSIAFKSNCFSIVSEGVIHGMRVRIDAVVERIVPEGAVDVQDVSFRTLAWKVTR